MNEPVPVIITQSGPRGALLREMLAAEGRIAVHVPLIETRPVEIPRDVLSGLSSRSFAGWIFTSMPAAKFWLEAMETCGEALNWRRDSFVCYCIGEATANVLRRAGLRARTFDGVGDAEGLAQALIKHVQPPAAFLFCKGAQALSTLPDLMRAQSYEIVEVTTYHTRPAEIAADQLTKHAPAILTLFSPSGVQALVSHPELRVWVGRSDVWVVPFGETTALEAERCGLRIAAKPTRPTHEALIATLSLIHI